MPIQKEEKKKKQIQYRKYSYQDLQDFEEDILKKYLDDKRRLVLRKEMELYRDRGCIKIYKINSEKELIGATDIEWSVVNISEYRLLEDKITQWKEWKERQKKYSEKELEEHDKMAQEFENF